MDRPYSKDEQTHYLKMIEAEQKEKNERLAHPKTFLEAITNFNVEYRNYLKAQENLQKAREHANKNWAQIIAEANHHSYFDGDKRGNAKPQTSTNQIRSLSEVMQQIKVPSIMPEKKDKFGLRCWYCGKVIQTAERRNIHCTAVENGLKCQYCGAINTVKDTAVMRK